MNEFEVDLKLAQPGEDDFANSAPMDMEPECTADPVVPEQFSVHDSISASWVTRHIVEPRAYIARVKHWAQREIRQAERDEQFFMNRYGQQLQDWVAGEIARLRGRRRSINLPAGTVGFRRAGPFLIIEDTEAVMDWAQTACPSALIVTRRIAKTGLYEHFQRTGEMPTGVRLLPEQDRFYIK